MLYLQKLQGVWGTALGKRFGLLCVLVLTALVLMTVERVFSSAPTPSVPEFTVKFVKDSYDITTKNPYTGVDETEQISNNSIEIKIKNQPFDYSDYQLYYNAQTKPHFAETNWTTACTTIPQSDSSYTTITFPVVPTDNYGETGYDIQRQPSGYDALNAIPEGSRLDFQVEAVVGHIAQKWVPDHWMFPDISGHHEDYVAIDETSGWSKTKTSTINENGESSSTVTLDTSDQNAFILAGALILIPIVAGVGLLIHLGRKNS
jgi:hypothetical protein